MNRVYTKVQFDPNNNRKTNPSKSGLYPIYIMVKQLRKKERIPLKIPNVSPSDFQDIEGKWVKRSSPHHRMINLRIQEIKFKIDEFILSTPLGNSITPKTVKDWFQKNHDFDGNKLNGGLNTFDRFLEDYIEKKRKGQRTYISAHNKIKAYNKPVTYPNLNKSWVQGFYKFLLEDPKHKVTGLTAKQYFDKIKTVYKEWAISFDFEPKLSVFEGFRFSREFKKEKRALSKNQIQQLLNLKFGDNSLERKRETVRDLFVFMCYTSRYYTELENLTFEKNYFVNKKNPNLVSLRGRRNKTNEFFNNPLHPPIVKEIFDKHNPIKKGRIFASLKFTQPSISINRFLKRFSEEIGSDFEFTIRSARYTFVSTTGAHLSSLHKMVILGHNDEKSQESYDAISESFQEDFVAAMDKS